MAAHNILDDLQGKPLAYLKPSPALRSTNDPLLSLSSYKPVASYNWVESPDPTLVVPGSPRVWSDRRLPITLARDTEDQFVDQSAFRCPAFPLAPLVLAVTEHVPAFDFKSIQIVSDRNNLRKRLRWSTDGHPGKEFRVDVDIVGGSMLFTRWGDSVEPASAGYGHSFEERMTRTESASGFGGESTGHHRIVSFDFLDLCMLVRFEVDAGYYTAPTASSPSCIPTSLNGRAGRKDSGITVIKSGRLVPQSSLIELKTRSVNTNVNKRDFYPQLLFSQTPTVLLARHNYGKFLSCEPLQLVDMAEEEWRAQRGLKVLGDVLVEFRELAMGHWQGGKFSLVCRGDKLEVFRREGEARLPPNLLAHFQ